MANRSEDYPEEVFALYNELRSDPTTNKFKIGSRIAEEFPALFGDYRPRSVCEAIRRQAQERGVDIVQSYSGGRPKLPEPDSRWLDATPECVIPYCDNFVVLSDIHAGLADAEIIGRALAVIDKFEVPGVVLNGDTWDFGHVGHKGIRSVWAPSYEKVMDDAGDIIEAVANRPSVEWVAILQGNHCEKPLRSTDGEFRFTDIVDKTLNQRNIGAEIIATNRFEIIMEPKDPQPWPFTGPENFPNRFVHQKEFRRQQLNAAVALGNIHPANYYLGHQHHAAVGLHPSGLYYVVDCGTLQAPELPAYKNERPSTHPAWHPAFVRVRHNTPEIWSMKNSDDWWRERLDS